MTLNTQPAKLSTMADPDSRENRNVDRLPEPDPISLGMYYEQLERKFPNALDVKIRRELLDDQKEAYRKEGHEGEDSLEAKHRHFGGFIKGPVFQHEKGFPFCLSAWEIIEY